MALLHTLRQRRQNLTDRLTAPILLWSGSPQPRNFLANSYPFRASSHFLYFAGISLENAVICLEKNKSHLFWDSPSAASTLWHGCSPTLEEVATTIGVDRAHPYGEIFAFRWEEACSIPVPAVLQEQSRVLGRSLLLDAMTETDRALAQAIVDCRLVQDSAALTEIRSAVAVTIKAHQAGINATPHAPTEAAVRAAIESVILSHNLTTAYQSIVTTHGEVLHNHHYGYALRAGGLVLADVGAESSQGWAADVTRTWPVSGKFSPSQRALYQIVLEAQKQCIAAVRSGVEYRDIHFLGCKVLTEGLIDVGILDGNAADLIAQDTHALFFPHGMGHLLGLDVHDMEDLGDIAGYAPGRIRSARFGLRYLRLDRPLQAGMVITIEPGFYQIPALLDQPDIRESSRHGINWERLAAFRDVRGIRIEDDVLVTTEGSEVLTAELAKDPDAIEAMLSNH